MMGTAVLSVVVLLLGAGTAAAQAANARSVDVLSLQLGSAVSTSDTDRQAISIPDPGLVPNLDSRYYTDVNAALRYSPVPGEKLSYGLNLQSSVRRYETGTEFTPLGHSAGGNVGWTPRERLSVGAFGSLSYVPSYSLNAVPAPDPFAIAAGAVTAGQLPTNAVDFSLVKRTAIGMSGGGGIDYKLGRRLTMSVAYQHSLQDYRDAEDPDLQSTTASGRISYQFMRYVGLRLGFQRRIADYDTGAGIDRVVLDDVDAGLFSNYGRVINLTRSTTLSFASGSNITHDEERYNVNLTGSASLGQRIGRRAQMTLGFVRGMQLQEGLERPVFSNSVSASTTIEIRRNLQAQFAAGGSLGRVQDPLTSGEQLRPESDVRSFSASARLSYVFLEHGQVFGQFLVSGHTVGDDVVLLEGVLRDHSNRTARVGVAWSVPLYRVRPRGRN